MAGWSIDPSGVQSVLASVETAAAELRTALYSAPTSFAELATGAGRTWQTRVVHD